MRSSALLVTLALLLLSSSCASGGDSSSTTTVDPTVVDRLPVDWPTPLVFDGARLLYGRRLTGEIFAVPVGDDGFGAPEAVATVSVVAATDDQRGLLGLASAAGGVYASWTRADDGRLVVGEVAPDERLVWVGPESTDRANGGHLLADPEGGLVIAVGDLLERSLVDDPGAPNGKVLRIDPLGDPDQAPAVLSGGWNNPFAFTFDADGRLWVADNAGPRGAERFGRGDEADAERFELADAEDQVAPSALVLVSEGLALCGFLTRTLVAVDGVAGGSPRLGAPLTGAACTVGATPVPGGRLVVADESGLTLIAPDSAGT